MKMSNDVYIKRLLDNIQRISKELFFRNGILYGANIKYPKDTSGLLNGVFLEFKAISDSGLTQKQIKFSENTKKGKGIYYYHETNC